MSRRRGVPPWVLLAVAVVLVGWLVLRSRHPVLAWLVFALALLCLVAVPLWRGLDRRARRRTRRTARPARVPAVRSVVRRPAVRVEPARPVAAGVPPPRLTGPQFEQLVADLLTRDGCDGVQVSGGAGDRGADIKAVSPEGHQVVVQCKCYRSHPVGDPDMQRFLGTVRQVHNAAIPLFVTTSRFTLPAAQLAREHGIVLVDGRTLADWQSRKWRLPVEPTEHVGQILSTSRGSPRPGVDLDDNAALPDLVEEEPDHRFRAGP
jgi:restriction system protein